MAPQLDAAPFTFAPLTPVSLLDRGVTAFGDRTAIVDGELRWSYRELAERCARLTSALAADSIGPGDKVAVLCSNSHVMLELHYAVPARAAVLVSVNIRLSLDEMVYIVEHSGASLLVATYEFAERAAGLAARTGTRLIHAGGPLDTYEQWLASAGPEVGDRVEVDERQVLSLNYTSGTTGRPKGVMIHHRGAFLQAVAMAHRSPPRRSRRRAQRPTPQTPTVQETDREDRTTAVAMTARIRRSPSGEGVDRRGRHRRTPDGRRTPFRLRRRVPRIGQWHLERSKPGLTPHNRLPVELAWRSAERRLSSFGGSCSLTSTCP